MALNGHAQGRQQPLGSVEVHDDPLIGFDVLATGGERLRIQAEIENNFLGRGCDPAEIGVGRQGRGIVDDDLGLLLGLRILRGWTPFGASLPSFSLISGSGDSLRLPHPWQVRRPETAGTRQRRSRSSSLVRVLFQRIAVGNASR